MSNIKLIEYSDSHKKAWDTLVDSSFNGTFMHTRDFLDYHGDKFLDHSTLFYKDDKICAVFPAARIDNNLISHPGATVGGLVFNDTVRGADIYEILLLHKNHYKNLNFIYKSTPVEFQRHAISDDIWGLFRIGAVKTGCEISTILNPLMTNYCYWPDKAAEINSYTNNIVFQAMPLHNLEFIQHFWSSVVIPNLQKYEVEPTHSPEDIHYLYSRFPVFIKGLYATYKDTDKILGGVIIFRFNKCYHVQYSVTTSKGRALNVLTFLHHYMITNLPSDVHYYNFGKSTEDRGHFLNESLYYYKNGFGGGSMNYDTYQY